MAIGGLTKDAAEAIAYKMAAEKLAEENERLRDALARFGGHAIGCEQGLHGVCSCGWFDWRP